MKLLPMERTIVTSIIALLKDCKDPNTSKSRHDIIIDYAVKELTTIFNEQDQFVIMEALKSGRKKKVVENVA